MIIRPLILFFRTQGLPNRAQSLAQKLMIIVLFLQFVFTLSETFYVLFVLDSVGWARLGILLAVSFLLQSILDYPSGALGDWVGQKWVLFFALVIFGISFAIVAFANPISFEILFVAYCLQAIAASQESGALIAWFDNNYKATADEADPDRETYKFFFGRSRLLSNITIAISIILGGILATIYFRQAVFAFQAILLIIIGFSFLIFLNDYPEVERSPKTIQNYLKLLREGVIVVFCNKALFFYTMAICCFGMLWTVWGTMILFPMYFGYTGSDAGAGTFRFLAWIVELPAAYYAANIAAKKDIKWIPRLQFLHTILFFSLFTALIFLYPFENNHFEPVAILVTLVIFATTTIIINIAGLLEQQIFLDAVPDKNRNSVYSLIPTLVRIAGAPAAIIAGILVVSFGFPLLLCLMGVVGLLGSLFSYLAIRIMTKEALEPDLDLIEPQPQDTSAKAQAVGT